MAITVGSLFSGAGMLDMGLAMFTDIDVRFFCEFDKDASKVLAHHHPEIPNLGDITKVDWSQIEPVDMLVGGSPCQDLSSAGKREGIIHGKKSSLFFEYARAAREIRPRFILFENVRAIVNRGLDVVLRTFTDEGYDCRWLCIRASETGVPHRRDRLFLLGTKIDAHTSDDRFARLRGTRPGWEGSPDDRFGDPSHPQGPPPDAFSEQPERRGTPGDVAARRSHVEGEARQRERSRDASFDSGPTPTDPDRRGCILDGERHGGTDQPRFEAPLRNDPDGRSEATGGAVGVEAASDSDCTGWEGRGGSNEGAGELSAAQSDLQPAVAWGKYEPAIRRWESVFRPVPHPHDERGRLSSSLVEWMMALPEGWVTSPEIGLKRTAQLKILGNGVVPPQACLAMRLLTDDSLWQLPEVQAEAA